MKKSKGEIILNIFIMVILHFGALSITLTLGLFALIVMYNKFIFDKLELLWDDVKNM